MRERVISRSINTEGLPITNAQLSNKLSDMGYRLVTNIDNITDRQFLATRRLPAPADRRTVTGISANVSTLQTTLINLETSQNVIKSNWRTTIKPTMIYEEIANQLRMVDNFRQDSLWKLKTENPELLSKILNEGKFLYSPFYYVIDSDTDEFGCRIYDLDTPEVKTRYFDKTNAGLGITLGFADYRIIKSPNNDGYYLDTLSGLS